MSDDFTSRLKARAKVCEMVGDKTQSSMLAEAAATIESLRQELEVKREQLARCATALARAAAPVDPDGILAEALICGWPTLGEQACDSAVLMLEELHELPRVKLEDHERWVLASLPTTRRVLRDQWWRKSLNVPHTIDDVITILHRLGFCEINPRSLDPDDKILLTEAGNAKVRQ